MKPSSSAPAARSAPYSPGRKRGFALVVTLSLMVLLTVIGVGLLTLGSISLRTSSTGVATATARANARMALVMAIGELQMQNGRDQSVTARADLLDEDSPNPSWTGAWKMNPASPATVPTPSWLVSGTNPNPATTLTEADSVALYKPLADSTGRKVLRAPLVTVKEDFGDGGYAWWVGDEGTKARVDLKSATATVSPSDRLTKSQSPQVPGLENLGSE